MGRLHRLIYISTATSPMTDEGLSELLRVARSRNSALSITGMLVYSKGFFIQALEGEKADIDAVFESIRKDSRNAKPYVTDESEIESRSFPNWSMGFRKLSPDVGIPEQGYVDLVAFKEIALNLNKRKDLAISLLCNFMEL